MPSKKKVAPKKAATKKKTKKANTKTAIKKPVVVKAKRITKQKNDSGTTTVIKPQTAAGTDLDSLLLKARDATPVMSIMEELRAAAEIRKRPARRFSSGVSAIDTIMSSRGVKGLKCGIYLLVGDPGAGKSSFALQIMRNMIENGHPGVYCAYEGKDQIYDAIRRIGLPEVVPIVDKENPRWKPVAEELSVRLKEIHEDNKTNMPAIVTIDTIKNLNSGEGGIKGRRKAMKELSDVVQATNTILFLIAHVSKETRGKRTKRIQGPAELEELCDVRIDLVDVTSKEEKGGTYRNVIVDISKNRFGRPGEFVGFSLDEDGFTWPRKAIERGYAGPPTKRSDDM